MLYQSFLKSVLINLTGYWFYKKKHLPTGVDPFSDLTNYYAKNNEWMVFDVGANNGNTALVLHSRLNNPIIYCFEPDDIAFDLLKTRTKGFKSIKTFQYGVGNVEKIGKLYKGKFSEWNSFLEDLNNTKEYTEAKIISLDSFMKEYNIKKINLLKTDTEGYDLEVLLGAEQALKNKNIDFIYTEAGFYDKNKRNTNFQKITDYLGQYGYKLFSIYHIAKGGTHMVNGNAMFVNEDLNKI